MRITTAMQFACIKDNEERKGVLKAFRMGGWLAYRPTPSGMEPALGDEYKNFPLGNMRLSQELVEKRFDWLDEEGKPQQPDWRQLSQIKKRQALVAAEKSGHENEAIADLEEMPAIANFLDFFGGCGGQCPFEEQEHVNEKF